VAGAAANGTSLAPTGTSQPVTSVPYSFPLTIGHVLLIVVMGLAITASIIFCITRARSSAKARKRKGLHEDEDPRALVAAGGFESLPSSEVPAQPWTPRYAASWPPQSMPHPMMPQPMMPPPTLPAMVAMSPPPTLPAMVQMRPQRGQPFQVLIDRSLGASLGIEVDYAVSGNSIIVSQVLPSGQVSAWNSIQPQRQVVVGDHIVEVNGVARDATAMMEQLRAPRAMMFTVVPKELAG